VTLTRATLGKLTKRQVKDVPIGDVVARIQRPTPLEFSQYQTALLSKDGTADVSKFADAIMLLVARMWIDDEGSRLFKDNELKDLGSIDLGFYQSLSAECQMFAQDAIEAKKTLGEFEKTTDFDLPAECA
jgi:hypothetical protein